MSGFLSSNFGPRSSSRVLSGLFVLPFWASKDTGAPAVGYCVVLLSGNFGQRGKLGLQLSVMYVLSCLLYICMWRGPERPREAQRGPKTPEEAQPKRPRAAQRASERHGDAQRGPERPREAQRGLCTKRGPERPSVDRTSLKSPRRCPGNMYVCHGTLQPKEPYVGGTMEICRGTLEIGPSMYVPM